MIDDSKQISEVTVSGLTYEEALDNGLQILGVGKDMVDIEVIDHNDDDLLPNAKPLEGVTLKLRPRIKDIIANAREHLAAVLELMGIDAKIETLESSHGPVLNILGKEDGALIIGKQGQNLEALQYMINRMATRGGMRGGDTQPITVDSEGYYEKHYQRLEDLANRAARRVLRDERVMEVAFPPMPASDRRLIHMILREVHGIHTISRGEGLARHIVVTGDRMEVIGSPLGETRFIKIRMSFDGQSGNNNNNNAPRRHRNGNRHHGRSNNYGRSDEATPQNNQNTPTPEPKDSNEA